MRNARRDSGGHVQSVAPAAKIATSTGSSADLSGFNGALAVILAGAYTDGTHTPKLQESNDNSTFTDVAAGDLEGSFAAIANNVAQLVGYKGRQRFVRIVVTVAGATTGAIYGASLIRTGAQQGPAA